MESEKHADYAAENAMYADPDVPLPPGPGGPGVSGPRAAEIGKALLSGQITTADEIMSALRRGRPSLSSGKRGESAVIRSRVSDADFAAFADAVERSGRSRSDLVRDYIHRGLVADGFIDA